MRSNRDDFTSKTIDILAKRVAFRCSNPDCGKTTIGPHEHKEKATNIGIAAHITGASPGGPRFDPSLSSEERRRIDNGIWLCGNCASLIDKDPIKYPVELLVNWRELAESSVFEELSHQVGTRLLQSEIPFIEPDIIWTNGGRWNRGYSPENKPVIIMGKDDPIIFWDLNWNFSIVLYNNSNFPAYNLNVEQEGDFHFNELTQLNKVNFLPALHNIEISAKFCDFIEGTYKEADSLLFEQFPSKLQGLRLKISYEGENRDKLITTVATLNGDKFINERKL